MTDTGAGGAGMQRLLGLAGRGVLRRRVGRYGAAGMGGGPVSAVERARAALDRWDGCDTATVDTEGWDHVRALLNVVTAQRVAIDAHKAEETVLLTALIRVRLLAELWAGNEVTDREYVMYRELRAALNGGRR